MGLDYRTVSARHATVRFKNGKFLFTDAGSSNGSYLYLRRPVELTSGQSVQFRLGRSIISMKVVNKWNKRLLKAMSRRAGLIAAGSSAGTSVTGDTEDRSVGSSEDDVRVTDADGAAVRCVPRRTREAIMLAMPPLGTLSQGSSQHLDLLYALAYPAKNGVKKLVPAVKPVRKFGPTRTVPGVLNEVPYGGHGGDSRGEACNDVSQAAMVRDSNQGANDAAVNVESEESTSPPAAVEDVAGGLGGLNLEEKNDEGELDDCVNDDNAASKGDE